MANFCCIKINHKKTKPQVMERSKKVKALKEKLLVFERETEGLIEIELTRINRTISISELAYVSFGNEVEGYIEAIKLDAIGNVVIETSFEDVEEKGLASFISDKEMTHWDLLELLEMLTAIT